MSIPQSGPTESICGFYLSPDTDDDGSCRDWIKTDELSEATTECKHPPEAGHDRCGLHLPVEERPEDFDETEAIRRRLEFAIDDYRNAGDTVNFIGIRLESELDLADFETELEDGNITKLDFRHAHLAGITYDGDGGRKDDLDLTVGLTLDHATVGQIDLSSVSRLDKKLSLRQATVGDDSSEHTEAAVKLSGIETIREVNLNEATIHGSLQLSQIKELGNLSVTDADVEGPVTVDGTKIDEEGRFNGEKLSCSYFSARGNAELNNASFRKLEAGKLDLSHATVTPARDEEISFRNLIVEGDCKLVNVSFTDAGKFTDASIDGSLLMNGTGCEFDGGVDFTDATVSGQQCNFDDATFSGGVVFTDATIKSEVVARGATIKAEANFNRADFYDPVFFDETRFVGGVTFNDATFYADSYFRSIVRPESTESTQSCVFQNGIGLRGAVFDGVADFRIFEAPEEAESRDEQGPDDGAGNSLAGGQHDGDPQGRYRGLPVTTDQCVVEGDVDAVEASLTEAKLTGFEASGDIDLLEADLSHATLQNATLSGANMERGVLNHCNLFGADLTNVSLYGAVFEGTRIDDDTKIYAYQSRPLWDRIRSRYSAEASVEHPLRYHREATRTVDEGEKVTLLNKAISTYSQLETLARENGQLSLARAMFVGKKNARRSRARIESGTWSRQWAGATAKKYVMNYGESWLRVVGTSALVVFVIALFFPAAEFTHSSAGELNYSFSLSFFTTLGYALLYSLASFTALGSGNFETGLVVDLLATVQSAVGILMLGLLLFVLQRRTAR